MTAQDIMAVMKSLENPTQARLLRTFFKTGKGQYGEGDCFLGLKVPQTREIVAQSADLSKEEIQKLLRSRYHEVRLCGLLLIVRQFQAILKEDRRWLSQKKETSVSPYRLHDGNGWVRFYLKNAPNCNNWDLVDLSCPKILGEWLMLPHISERQKWNTMDKLAASDNLWKQRISVVSTWLPLTQGRADFTLHYAEYHLGHSHDLMHKAVGWMLREMGKRVSMDLLCNFLEQHIQEMPRTALRYAIEKMSPQERVYWMSKDRTK